jgi:AcrR family transcriptional regulator
VTAKLPTGSTTHPTIGARERLMRAAYELFSQHGVAAVGIDTVIARSGVAKMSLYKHFRSKEELILAFLQERERVWTHQWVEAQMLARGATPEQRLLAIFEIFDEWFQKPDFEGCSFINVLLGAALDSPVRQAAAGHLAQIRQLLLTQIQAANLADPETFAQIWHCLMKGCIVTAGEGNRSAARQARQAAAILLEHWPRI